MIGRQIERLRHKYVKLSRKLSQWSAVYRALPIIVMLCVMLMAGTDMPALAQDTPPDDEGFIDQSIAYGETVNATISDESVFDFWRFYGIQGDTITITMVGADGLAPLIGLATQSLNITVRSDQQPDGSFVDAAPNSKAELTYTIPETGEYVINASRAGTVDGTTTGSYALTLTVDNVGGVVGESQDVTFLCGRDEVTTAMTITLVEDRVYSGLFRISVLGLDGFRPVVRSEASAEGEPSCTADGSTLAGARFTIPDQDEIILPDEDPENVAQLVITEVGESGEVVITVGSIDGAPGRFLMLIEGVSLKPAGDIDRIVVRSGPLAATAPTPAEIMVYAIHAPETRLDTAISGFVDDETGNTLACDDAGRRDCADVTSADQFHVLLPEGLDLRGERLDAGVRIATGNTARVYLDISSRSDRTEGNYYLLVLGSLPDRKTENNE